MKTLTRSLTSVDLQDPNLDTENTILDEEGGVIQFPGRFLNWEGIRKVESMGYQLTDFAKYYPDNMKKAPDDILNVYNEDAYWTSGIPYTYRPVYDSMGQQHFDNLQSSANNLIRTMRTDEYAWSQIALKLHYQLLTKETFGKSGLFNRNILGYRMPGSVTFVCTGDPHLTYGTVAIPSHLAYRANIKNGDWVMVIRNPVLHNLSVIPMQAKVCHTEYGAIPMLAFHGLNADCDGDMISVTKLPEKFTDDQKNVTTLKKLVAKNLKESQLHGTILFSTGGISKFGPRYGQDELLQDMCSMDGISFGPEDMLDMENSAFLKRMTETGAKSLKPSMHDTFEGSISLQESSWAVIKEQVAIKLLLGMAGWVGTCALLVGVDSCDQQVINAGFYIKEKLSQKVLDCKHGEDISELDAILAALSRQAEFKKASIEDICSALDGYHLDSSIIEPLLRYCDPYNFTSTALFKSPAFVASTSTSREDSIDRMLRGANELRGVTRYTAQLLEKVHGNAFRQLENVGSEPAVHAVQ